MKIKQLLFSSLGNVLEWFDFGLFIYFAPILGQTFFPTATLRNATFIAFTIFAGGFICRPLGGIFFGHLGDRFGRSRALRLSILTISFSTLLIGLLPSYKTMGVAAPILFSLVRFVQGFAIGGEYSGIMIYLAESTPHPRRGFLTSFAAVGANLGFLLAALSFLLLKCFFSEAYLNARGWRLPFILVGCLGILLFYYRFSLQETPIYQNLKKFQKVLTHPLMRTLRFAPLTILKIFGLTCMNTVFYYFFFAYLPHYLTYELNVSHVFAMTLQTFSLCGMLILVPIFGLCGDALGRRKMLIFTGCGMILLTLPCIMLLQLKTSIAICAALSIATLLSSLEQGNTPTTLVENCPTDVRYSAIGLAYNLGNGVAGGTAPLIFNLLGQHFNALAPAYYIMFMISLGLLAVFSFLREGSMRPLYKAS